MLVDSVLAENKGVTEITICDVKTNCYHIATSGDERRKQMKEYVKYEHWEGKPEVWVRKDLRGRHREYCLCHSCAKFDPEDRENNCPIARANYAMCVEFNMTIPVWECPYFDVRDANGSS